LEQREADTFLYTNSERTSWSKEKQIHECIGTQRKRTNVSKEQQIHAGIGTQREPVVAKRSRYMRV
jgi:hypothetical protein